MIEYSGGTWPEWGWRGLDGSCRDVKPDRVDGGVDIHGRDCGDLLTGQDVNQDGGQCFDGYGRKPQGLCHFWHEREESIKPRWRIPLFPDLAPITEDVTAKRTWLLSIHLRGQWSYGTGRSKTCMSRARTSSTTEQNTRNIGDVQQPRKKETMANNGSGEVAIW